MMSPGFGLLENGSGRPQMMMATGGIGMLSPIRSAPMEAWDMKAMAAHRHRILVSESSAQRMEIEGHIQALPAQTCPPGFRPSLLHSELPPPNVFPPGFRPAPLHSELPLPNVFPPGFRPQATYNDAMLPQSCPPGFRPPVESASIMQPETKFRSPDPITYRPEFRFDDRPGDPAGMHDTMRGPSMHGAGDRHGWYPNESSSGAERVLESRFADPPLSRPYETEGEHVRNLYCGAELENKNWRLPNSQLLSPVPVPNVTQPLAYNPEAFWPGNIRGDSLAGNGEAGKRRSFEDNSPRTPPFKRPRAGHEVESNAPAWARSRLESEIAWSNGLRMSDDKSRDYYNEKRTERRKKFESSNGTLDRWHDKEESSTRRSPPHFSSSPDRNRFSSRLEVSQKPEFRSRPSSFREISQSDISSFRASPRPVYSNGKEKQYRKSLNPGSWSSGLSQNSRSPTRRSNYDRRSLELGERDSWPPRLPAGKISSGVEIDHWRSVDARGKVERNTEENGSLRSLHSSRVLEERLKDRGRIDSQLLSAVTKEKSAQCGSGGSMAPETYNSLENVAPTSTDGIKIEKPLGTVQRLSETKSNPERCEPLERMPLYKNGAQFSTEKAGLRSSKRGENHSASAKPISATSLKITRYFTNNRLTPKYYASQHSEVDWKTSVEKVTPWGRRTVFVSSGPSLPEISGSDEGAAEEQDEAEEGEILHTENRSKASRLQLERSSVASETQITEGDRTKLCVALPRVSPEVIVHPSSVVDVTEGQVTKVGTCGNERAGQKWISTGFRSKQIPGVKLLKTASGSDSQSPGSLGKSHIPGGCVLTEDAPCSQQMEEGSPTSTVRNGRVSVVAGVKRLPDNPSVPTSGLVSGVKEQIICAAGELKSDVDSLRNSVSVSGTQNPKPSLVAKKSFLQESSVQRQNSGQFRSSCNSRVGDVKVKPFVGVSGSLLDDWLSGITSSIPLATDTDEGFKSNGSTSESLQVSVKSELRHSLTSNGEKQAEQPSAVVREKTASVKELAKVVVDKKKAAVVQGRQDTKVVLQPSDLQNASSTGGDMLARQRDREGTRQGDSTSKLASFLAGAGSPLVTEMAKGMSVVSQRPGLQELRYPGGNTRAERKGKTTMRGTVLATNLKQVMTREGEVTLSDSEDDFEVITEPSRGVVPHFDRELGKRRKLMHPEKGGNLKQVLFAANSPAKMNKIDVPEQSSGPEKFKADATLMKKHVPILKGGIQRTSPVMKTIDILPLSSHLSVQTPPSRTVGRSFVSNKTWRREATPVNSQQLSNTPQKPAVVAQPSTYIRKKFSIVRNPAPQVPHANVVAQPNIFPKFPQVSVTPSRNRTYSLSASKPKQLVSSTAANTAVSASASPIVKTSNTKLSDLGAVPSEKPRPSPVKRLQPLGDETSVTHSESIVAESLPVPQISPSKPSHREGSSDMTTLASSPVSKSPGGATTDGYVVSGTRLYRKRKFDEVRVGPSTTSASPNLKPGSEKCDVPQGYIKRKTNQLVRCDHPGVSAKDALQKVSEGGDKVKFVNKQRRHSSQLRTKTKLGRVLSQKKGSLLGLGRVWTLNNEGKQTTTALGTSRDWRYPLFPWKRSAVVAPRLRRGRSLHEGKMGALFFHISNQLQKYRSAHPVYTRSADGFSLHRSGVVSKSGANLKWTKSLKTQSILASEAATKVVAEAEKKKRDKKEAVVTAVAKARNERRAKLRSGSVNPSPVSSLKPLGIGGSVYVRKGFGNQLVRNLKTVARAVASEKFRWSLRNARLRRAKKQSYCVYYTRFGVCKRGDGKCLYIHDPEKVAVCAKFLRGSCSDSACRLTHKVIPERMSDCSYFLEGLCTNESCPYRHVNVSKEAPICEAFLQGYCADGDKCTKKHTYVCPEYTLTGSCSSSTCKLRHPKKATKESADPEKEAPKRELQKGRYFTLTAPAEADHQGQPIATANKIAVSGDELMDFISIDEYDSESSKEYQKTGSL